MFQNNNTKYRVTQLKIGILVSKFLFGLPCTSVNTIFHFFRRGTNVMLCANHRPILNDVTHAELQLLLYRVSKISPVIANGLSTGRLTCYSSGQASPCLDLSRLNKVSNVFGKKILLAFSN